jgi:DNA-directed RNA polymerase subunit RPC12/RpoP
MSRVLSPVALHAHQCPRCGHREIERASRRGLMEEMLLPLLGLRPYRCVRCLRRFYDRPQGRSLAA